MNNKGQVILLLILVMTVALAIGLSVVQKSLVDISTASKVEQSSRAFSAAEAGIEKTLLYPTGSCGTDCNINFSDNSSTATVSDVPSMPAPATVGNRQEALEFPPLAKEDVAQVWLADLNSAANPPTEFYMPGSKTTNRGIEIYWGSTAVDKAAISIKIIYFDGTNYSTMPYYYDSDLSRATSNGFTGGSCATYSIDTTSGINRSFYCKQIITAPLPFPSLNLMLVRIRLLYNSGSQPVAVRGFGTCGHDCSLPAQARTIISTGISGETQRKVKVFQLNKVVPPYFDYAIFSAGDILK